MRAREVKPRGRWSGSPADTITLDNVARHRRRITLTADGGVSFLLELADAAHMHDGDGLLLEDGRIIEVKAKLEELSEIRGRDDVHLLRLAWHIGNRHLAAQITMGRILIQRDPVIAAMLRGLGASVRDVEEPFDPEGGAYAGAHHHDV
jgi:urease accessory protein